MDGRLRERELLARKGLITQQEFLAEMRRVGPAGKLLPHFDFSKYKWMYVYVPLEGGIRPMRTYGLDEAWACTCKNPHKNRKSAYKCAKRHAYSQEVKELKI